MDPVTKVTIATLALLILAGAWGITQIVSHVKDIHTERKAEQSQIHRLTQSGTIQK